MLLLIDNYDSFTYNLAHYFMQWGQEVQVVRNDQISLADIGQQAPAYIVISPGPCTPNEAGISLQVIEQFAGHIPILGVCLGHQAIGQVFGAKVVHAPQVMHGKTSAVYHDGKGLFKQMPQPFLATRYHSLIVDRASIPETLKITAWTEDDIVMGIEHKEYPLYGVQFHPEAILTEEGHRLLGNFLGM